MKRLNKIGEEEAKKIAFYLLKKGIRVYGDANSLYAITQRAAAELGIIEENNGIDMGLTLILTKDDYLKVSDVIWNYFLKGYLAPGMDHYNGWFPHTHLTEKGKEYIKSLE